MQPLFATFFFAVFEKHSRNFFLFEKISQNINWAE